MVAVMPSISLNQPTSDGALYCSGVPLPPSEADLANTLSVPYGQALLAQVVLQAQGSIGSQNGYVVLQQSLDRTNWFDLAWLITSMITGTQVWMLSTNNANNNALQQTRTAGSAPGSTGSTSMMTGGILRFVGKTSLPTGPNAILATIYAKTLGLR